MENPIKMDDLGVPPISGNTHMSSPDLEENGFDDWRTMWGKFLELLLTDGQPNFRKWFVVGAIEISWSTQIWMNGSKKATILPSWELTYPLAVCTFESMTFLFPRRDMLVPWRVVTCSVLIFVGSGNPNLDRWMWSDVFPVFQFWRWRSEVHHHSQVDTDWWFDVICWLQILPLKILGQWVKDTTVHWWIRLLKIGIWMYL